MSAESTLIQRRAFSLPAPRRGLGVTFAREAASNAAANSSHSNGRSNARLLLFPIMVVMFLVELAAKTEPIVGDVETVVICIMESIDERNVMLQIDTLPFALLLESLPPTDT